MELSWREYHEDCERLAAAIRAGATVYDRMLCVARGGVFVGGLLAHLLDYRKITTIALWSYRGRASGEAVELLTEPDLPPAGGQILVVDDLLDSGRTFAWIRQRYGSLYRLDFAVLHDKGGGGFRPRYAARTLDGEWIVYPWEGDDG